MSSKKPSPLSEAFRFVFRRQLPLETETTVFILISAADIFMTWILLSSGGFIESNPIARYFLETWGRMGFVGFKMLSVTIVCVIAQFVATQKPSLARGILNFGSAVVLLVVLYSASLLLQR